MSTKEENPSLTGYYSMEKFIKELKKISGIPDSLVLDEFQSNLPLHTSNDGGNAYFSPYYKNRIEQKSKIAPLTKNREFAEIPNISEISASANFLKNDKFCDITI